MQQEFQGKQVVGSHVKSFLPSLFEKNTLRPMLARLLMLDKLSRLDFHHICKDATSAFLSLSLAPFHF